MREKGQTEAAKTLETPVFSRSIEFLTEKLKLKSDIKYPHKIVFVREYSFLCQQQFCLCIIICENVYFLFTNTYLGQRLSIKRSTGLMR